MTLLTESILHGNHLPHLHVLSMSIENTRNASSRLVNQTTEGIASPFCRQ